MSFVSRNQLRIGGKTEGDRHFRVVEVGGKSVSLGGVSISDKASPGDAARKLLKSIAHDKGLEKMKKLNMGKVKFHIQEYTQGSKKKVYGPYEGYYRKYTAEELKKAKTAKGKVKFTMKPVVKLNKNAKKMNKVNNVNNVNKVNNIKKSKNNNVILNKNNSKNNSKNNKNNLKNMKK